MFEFLESRGEYEVGGGTYDALVSACISLKSIRGVKRVFGYMIGNGFELDQYMRNRVLLMHVKCGMMIHARHLFEEMPERNSVSWNTIIGVLWIVESSWSRSGCFWICGRSFLMGSRGYLPQ
ncbi:putative pentatricopeptide [Rosa chinensis]|uniref:Putative pentatricopeptide n=1 Tax=Rosa chinensis TaxID=74649 RepID=A0A2P6S4I4_ROSCH|nr:putative pentatricopeptide [Rosa chinensis]